MSRSEVVFIAFIFVAASTLCKKAEAPREKDAAQAVTTEAVPTEEKKGEGRITGPVARVNGVDIDNKLYYDEIEKITQGGTRAIPEERLKKIKENILKRLIEEELIRQTIKKENIEVTEKETEEAFEEFKKRFKTQEQFENYLKYGKTTVEQIKKRVQEKKALEKLLAKTGTLNPSEEEARQHYEANERFYTEREMVKASHILVKLPENPTKEQENEAKRKLAEIEKALKKEDFAEVAKKFSEDVGTKDKGGDLDYFTRGQMVKPFEDAAFSMKPGEVTKTPVRSQFGYHIIKVFDYKPEKKKSFEEVKDQIMESLKNKNFYKVKRDLLTKLTTEAKIEKFIQ